MKIKLPDHPRILITRTDRIGDLVVSTPVFRALREKFPHSHIAVCVFQEHRELVVGNPYINEVILYDKSGREKNWFGQLNFAIKVSRKKFDCVIHLHATNRMHVMSWLAKIPIRLGYDRRAAWALTNVHAYDKKEGERHEAEYLFDLLTDFEITKPSVIRPRIIVYEKSRLSVENLLEHSNISSNENIAIIHPSASDITKVWPAEKFSELILSFALGSAQPQKNKFRWVAVGGPDASTQAEKIQNLSGIPIINFCGKLSLGQLAALFEKANLVISNDSGPAHIAAATGVPTVSIFGRWQPGLNAERWRPLGDKTAIVIPQIQNIPVQDRKFSYIEDITVTQVINAIKQVLT